MRCLDTKNIDKSEHFACFCSLSRILCTLSSFSHHLARVSSSLSQCCFYRNWRAQLLIFDILTKSLLMSFHFVCVCECVLRTDHRDKFSRSLNERRHNDSNRKYDGNKCDKNKREKKKGDEEKEKWAKIICANILRIAFIYQTVAFGNATASHCTKFNVTFS